MDVTAQVPFLSLLCLLFVFIYVSSLFQEGKEFLEQEAPELVKTPKGKEGVETRGKTQARATIDSLLSTNKVCYLSLFLSLSYIFFRN